MNFTPTRYGRNPSALKPLALLFMMLAGTAIARLDAQTCTYTIQMIDSFGDGWNGGTLTVTSDGVVTTHTLPSGSNGTSTFQVTAGAPITISWTAGSFAFEPSFNLLNSDGLVLFSAGNPYRQAWCSAESAPAPTAPFPIPTSSSSIK
jgi:hypothetical protein